MRKNVFVFGCISGVIVASFMIISLAVSNGCPDYDNSMYIGYASMLLAFSFVFVGIKNFRDKYNNGVISFGKALKNGLYITLVASTFYVVTWLVEYYLFIPDFMETYTNHMLDKAKESGISASELAKKTSEMATYKDLYKNPLFVILFTYLEILPVGLIVSILSALILKRKIKPETETVQ